METGKEKVKKVLTAQPWWEHRLAGKRTPLDKTFAGFSAEFYERMHLKWRITNMTKAELINAVAQKTELSKKDSEKAVVAVIDANF